MAAAPLYGISNVNQTIELPDEGLPEAHGIRPDGQDVNYVCRVDACRVSVVLIVPMPLTLR